MYLHRKTCFEGLGVEQAILSRWSGFGPIHTILDNSTQDPFLKGTHEQFEFISLEALLVLLDSNDPLLVSDSQTLSSPLMEEVKYVHTFNPQHFFPIHISIYTNHYIFVFYSSICRKTWQHQGYQSHLTTMFSKCTIVLKFLKIKETQKTQINYIDLKLFILLVLVQR